jgi:hypothetical protein
VLHKPYTAESLASALGIESADTPSLQRAR